MKICVIGKYPPIQGGVSGFNYRLTHALARLGHTVIVVTNANEVESEYRMGLSAHDVAALAQHYDSRGSVEVVNTTPTSVRYAHVPRSNPYVTKLAGLSTDVIRQHGADVIFGSYFEPYGLAAYLAAQWTGVPYVVQHAGSDLSRLMNQPDLTRTYKEMLRHANGIVTHNARPFLGMGIARHRIYEPDRPAVAPWFSPDTEPMDINATLQEYQSQDYDLFNLRPLNSNLPVVGIYGKPGPFKGMTELIEAIALLHQANISIQLVCVAGHAKVLREVAIQNAVESHVWILPFLPPWRVPNFIAASTAIAFLEHDFPIKFHTPSVSREVMASAKCLITTREIVQKLEFADRLQHQENVLVVDPFDVEHLMDALAFVAQNRFETLQEIGRQGHALFREVQTPSDQWALSYAEIFTTVIHKTRSLHPSDERDVNLHAVSTWLPRTERQLPGGVLESLWQAFTSQSNEAEQPNDLLVAWTFSRFLLQNYDKSSASYEAIQWDEARLWQWNDKPNGLSFALPDRLALRKHSLDDYKPVKVHMVRILSIAGQRLLFLRTPNLIDAPVLEIDHDTEQLLEYCTGDHTVAELDRMMDSIPMLREKLWTLYTLGGVVFA